MKKINLICLIILILLSLTLTLFAAQKTFTTYTWDRNIHVSAGGGITPPGSDFPDPPQNDPDENPVIPPVDPETGTIILGNNMNSGSGAIWYGGTTTGCNACTSGVCTFGIGFRAYFEFKFTTADISTGSTTYGDGFNFIIANTSNNDITKRGGSPNDEVDMGELIGYAGSGNTHVDSDGPLATPPLDGLGIEPPKMAIEIDTYPNTGAMTYNGCSGGRQDNDNDNHIALMFWGTNPGSGTMCDGNSTADDTFPRASFDDNIHRIGDGSTSNPYNSAASGNGSGLGGYYERARSTYNWLEDAQWHRARIEVIRTPSSATYQVKAWIDCESYNSPYTACPAGEFVYFQNVLNPYDNSSYLPKIDRTQQLDGTLNTMLNNIIFGFTVATGGATQNILINNFSIYFPRSTVGTPSNLSFTPSGGSGTVSVTAVDGCPWTTSNNGNTWITIIPANSTGTGSPQTVNYTVANNTGSARTGTMTIAGQTFTVTQTGCAYAINPSSRSHTYSAASGQTVAVTAGTGCAWTAVSNDGWITITGGASGTGNGTVTYSITINNGPARIGTITIGGQTFTVNQAAGPPTCTLVAGTNIVPYNSTNSLTWSVSGSATTANWTTSPGGTCGSPNPVGGSCTTAAQTTAGARTYTLTVSNAYGSSSCSTTFYVGCQNYRVWNGLGGTRDFYINGGCRNGVGNNNEITQTGNRLDPGETIQAYASAGTCTTALGIVLDYNDAMNVDITVNGGDGDCRVNFTGNHTATDN